MKGKPIEKSSQLFHSQEEYLIIGYTNHDDLTGKYTAYYILDENLHLYNMRKNALVISDNNDANFVKVFEDKYATLFMDPDFVLFYEKSLVKDGRVEFNTNIWDDTWLAYCLNKKGVELNKVLKFCLQDKDHKVNYIHGLLDFATDFMNFDKDFDAHYDIFFQVESGERKRLQFEREFFKTIDDENVEEIIIEDIERYLFKGNKIENFDGKISYLTSRKIFLLIDCLFLNKAYKTYTFYDGFKSSKIIFENDDFCCALHFDESD